jgi:glycine betaine transporter
VRWSMPEWRVHSSKGYFPWGTLTSALAVFLIAIFFVTGADSASIVMGMLSQNGCEEPRRGLTVFWGVTTGAVAGVLLWSGGLKALQTLVILVAGPFMLILIAMCLSTLKALRDEPYESTLPPRVRRAVLHAQRQDRLRHQSIALATLGCEGLDDGERPDSDAPRLVGVDD